MIGKFCALATDVRFIMGGANHRMNGVSTFPFPIFGADWAEHFDLVRDVPASRDTTVGNDVWIGRGVTVMPGVSIGDGAIVASGAVVVTDVAPYALVGGNPATLIRLRFADDEIRRLLELAWWDWPMEKITENVRVLMDASVVDVLDPACFD